MGFLALAKYFFGVDHHFWRIMKNLEKKTMGFGLDNIHPLFFIALIEGTIELY
jgi:hypothetical protein